MDIFDVFQIVQVLPNRAKFVTVLILEEHLLYLNTSKMLESHAGASRHLIFSEKLILQQKNEKWAKY